MPQQQFRISLLFLGIIIISALFLGTIVFHFLEGWSFVDSFYFVSITATTVGYGDLTPTHPLSKMITVIYALSIVPFVLYVSSLIAEHQTHHVYHKLRGMEQKQHLQEAEIEKAEQRLAEQKHQMKEQEEEIERQEKKLKEQTKINEAQSKELGVVEDIMEDVLAKA